MALNFLSRSDGDSDWSLQRVDRPWPDDRPAIRDFILDHTTSDGTVDADLELPDQEWLASMKNVRFIPGLYDRMMLSHDDPQDALEQANAVLNALRNLCRQARTAHLRQLHETIVTERMSDAFPALSEWLETERWTKPDRLRAVARVLIAESPERDAVKVGLLCLATAGAHPDDLQLVTEVGRHGEFTGLAVVALARRVEGWERAVWNMAAAMPGWGRVAALEQLEGVADPDIRRWMLTEGWRDDPYVAGGAFVCALTGGLISAFDSGAISLEDTGGLLEQLVHGQSPLADGDRRGLAELPGGAEFVERYVGLLQAQTREIWQYETARLLEHRCSSRYGRWKDVSLEGWTPERRKRICTICREILDFPGWERMAREAIASADPERVQAGLSLAWSLELPLWDYWWEQAKSDPKFDDWWRLTRELNEDRIDAFLEFALQRFDLDALGSGPGDDFGLGPAYKLHRELDTIATTLRGFPGRGWPFIRAALNSPVPRNRIWATRTVARWGKDAWPPEVEGELRRLASIEPDAEQRERLRATLRGEPDDTPEDPLAGLPDLDDDE